MMDAFSAELNITLVDTYRSINKVEEQAIKNMGIELSISEMHLIEAVGKEKETGRTISDIAQELGITLPSVTVAINKLVKKGYVQKIKGESDGRTVYVVLTKSGRKIDAVHRYFHQQMVRKISEGFSDEEKEVLLKGIQKLNKFFKQNIQGES